MQYEDDIQQQSEPPVNAELPKEKIGKKERAVSLSVQVSIEGEDLERAVEIYRNAFAGPPWFERWDEESARAEFSALTEKNSVFLLLRSENAVVGFAISYDLSKFRAAQTVQEMGLPAGSLYLAEVAVAPEFQGFGYSTLLITESVEYAGRSGYPALVSQTRDDNTPMIRAFERNKMTPSGKHSEATGGKSSERVVYAKATGGLQQ